MNIAIPIFDRITALDAVGPYEVLCGCPAATVHFIAARGGTEAHRDTDAGADRRQHCCDDLPIPRSSSSRAASAPER